LRSAILKQKEGDAAMKKLASALLALVMMTGLFTMTAGAFDDWMPVLELGQPAQVQPQDGWILITFTPPQSGWYVFSTDLPADVLGGWYSLGTKHDRGTSFELLDDCYPVLYNRSNRRVGGDFPYEYSFASSTSLDIFWPAQTAYYLQGGQEYEVMTISLDDAICNVTVQKAEDFTGRGNVRPRDLTLYLDDVLSAAYLFPCYDPPRSPYPLLRVEVLDSALDQNFAAVKTGKSTLVFYDWAGNEVGRSTVRVKAKWWQRLSPSSQRTLRNFAFGQYWMYTPNPTVQLFRDQKRRFFQ